MYTNPFNRKHSTIRQVIDRFLHPDYNNNKSKSSSKESLKRVDSNSSRSSYNSNINYTNNKNNCNMFGQQRRTISAGK